MVNHMKTTLNISDVTMRALKREAARRGQTMSALVEAALRDLITPKPPSAGTAQRPKLPQFHGGAARVDVADRDALYEVMER
jgi:hypothetical protein